MRGLHHPPKTGSNGAEKRAYSAHFGAISVLSRGFLMPSRPRPFGQSPIGQRQVWGCMKTGHILLEGPGGTSIPDPPNSLPTRVSSEAEDRGEVLADQ